MRTQFKQKRFHSPENLEGIWQILYPEHFINVLLIHHLKRQEEKEILGVASIMRSGLMHVSPGNPKKSHEISDIFKPFRNEDDSITDPKLILIDGAPGMGKTTLCKEIAYQWANDKLLIDTKVVFLLFLRDPAIQKINDLKDFIHYFYKFEPTYLDLSKQCAKILVKRDNRDVMILMDGYDDFNDNKRNDSLIKNIIERDVLSQCRIVITSRPIASENLQKIADVRVEVLGFTKESRSEYIEKELREYPEKVKSLLRYLNDHSDISRVCTIPIMMTIFVCTFKEIDELPTNQSEVYERFIGFAISRCVQKLDKASILSLNRLPNKYQAYLHQLSEFAFKTIEDGKIVFSDKDIERLSPSFASSSKKYQGLGLFRATEHLNIKNMENCIWYNFLHLSIHEFLAAYYLKTLEPLEQFKILKRTLFIKRYINAWTMFVGLQHNVTYDFHHSLTYYHIQDTSDAVKGHVMLLVQKLHLLSFSEIMNFKLNNIKGIFQFFCSKKNTCTDHLLTNMIYENIANFDTACLLQFSWWSTNLFLSLCNTDNSDQLIEIHFFDKNMDFAVYYQLIEALKENQNLSVMLLSSNTLVGYRCNHHQLTNALNMNKSLEFIIVRYCLINKDIANALSSYLKNSHCLKSLSITNSKDSDNPTYLIAVLQMLKENCNLKVLDLESNDMTGNETEDIVNVIKNNSGLVRLYLSNNSLKSSAIVILQALKDLSKITILDLNNNNMTGQVAEDLANVIKNNPGLEELYLSDNSLKTSAGVILKALKQNSFLTKLHFNDNLMTEEVAEDLAGVIKNNINLEELCIGNNELGLSAIMILQALQKNCRLKVLNLSQNNLTAHVAEDLARIIKNNQGIKELYLSNNNLKTSAVVIIKALKENLVLTKLYLNNTLMTDEVAEDLSNIIKNNTNLQALHIDNNNLGLSAAPILQALQENCNLQTLDLGSNIMTGQVVEDLADVIKNNPGLKELCLSDNKLETSAAVILKALKEKSLLTKLYLSNTLMTEEVAEDLADVIKSNSNLQQLRIGNNKLGLSAVMVLQALQKNHSLKVLNLSQNNLTVDVAEDLATIIKNNSSLEELYLYDNDLQASVGIILKVLKENSLLTKLYLNNSLMTEVAEDLAAVIKNNTNLQKLRIDSNRLGLTTAPILRALKEGCNLQMLNLENNNMTEQVAEDLANVIKSNPGLEELYLSDNNFKTSATTILQALQKNALLQKISLQFNSLTEEISEYLADVIQNNTDLKDLDLGYNMLGPSTVVVLQALKRNCKLKILNLCSNNMTGRVAEHLANVSKNNSGLKQLCLSDNDLKSSAVVIFKALKENTELEGLYLQNNNMTGKVAEDLAKLIKNNYNLKKLSLENNMLGPSLLFILQALKCNLKLEALNLSGNNFTGQVSEELANVIKNNSGLNELYLSNCNLKSFVAVILEHISQLKCLHLNNNNILDIESTAIVQVIKNSSLIFDLCLGDNMLQSSLIDIATSCSSLTNLQVLELSHNIISATQVVCLASIIAKISSLEVLMLDGLVLSAKERFCFDIFQIFNISRQKSVLKECNNNEVMEITCLETWQSQFVNSIKFKYTHKRCFSAAIMTMKKILNIDTEHHLSTVLLIAKQSEQKLLQLDAANMIVSLSRTIKILRVLDLGHSNIKEEAAVELATALNCNNVLEQLWLRGNVLGADGAAVILISLQNITTLRVLDLSYNNISSTSANGIAAVINSNHFLEQLWLDGNMLMTTGVVIIASALKKHSNLRLLSLSNNEITEDAAEEISAIVNSNTLLGGLLLGNNLLQSVGIGTIAKSLTGIKYLHVLELTNNSVEDSNPEQLSLEILPL